MNEDFLIEEIRRVETDQATRKVIEHDPGKPLWREYLETAVIALVAAVLLRLFVVSAYRVNSGSMEDTLLTGDYIFVNKLAYEYGTEPRIGDIVVFKYPNNPSKEYIKRIVALPGQTVQIADKVLYVDAGVASIPIHSKHSDKRIIPGDLSFRDNFQPFLVTQDEYFVMGDNRDDSRDSRFWGTVPKENFLGKAVFVYWSWAPGTDAPAWEFPYIVNIFQWSGYFVFNFPSHIRWGRLGTSI